MKRIYSLLFLSMLALTSCNFLDPIPIDDQTTDELWVHGDYGEGILTAAYQGVTTSAYTAANGGQVTIFGGNGMSFDLYNNCSLEYLTDNAVPYIAGANALALGRWTLENNTIGNWDHYYNMLKYVNLFLENSKDLIYAVTDTYKDSIINSNRIGEAYFLRAWYHWRLLQEYGGLVDGESQAMGVPLVTKFLTRDDVLDVPRSTYEECLTQIEADCDSAIRRLPFNYTSNGTDQYTGYRNVGRASSQAAMALKARACLYAASPAFGNSTQATWERAANMAFEVIKASGGLSDLTKYGNFNDSKSGDHFWISTVSSTNLFEQSYYPPSLYGTGECNPTQNLVDAFPAKDGYPIDKSPVYDSKNPYANRDSRLAAFIFFNGDVYNKSTINTYQGGVDAPGGLSQYGTRTGYYLKKFMSTKITLVPGNEKSDYKFNVFLGKAELYLNFAEAANEAWGPSDARLGISAADALKVIRKRAIGTNDPYLNEQVALGKDAFRTLLQNERRIELCFEGHRFWDIRRWNLPLDHTVRAARISFDGTSTSYEYVDLENHTFQDYQRYVPVPYEQVLIMSKLKQNSGWK